MADARPEQGLGRDGLEDRRHGRVRLLGPAGHDGGAVARALLAAADADAHVVHARLEQLLRTPHAVGPPLVPAVHDHVARVQHRHQPGQHGVDHLPGDDEHDDAPRARQRLHEPGHVVVALDGRAALLVRPLDARVHALGLKVVHRHVESVRRRVQRDARAHHAHAVDAEVAEAGGRHGVVVDSVGAASPAGAAMSDGEALAGAQPKWCVAVLRTGRASVSRGATLADAPPTA